MMNDKDVKAVFDLFYEFHDMDNLGLLRSKLVEYVAQTRKDARAAAFKEAVRTLGPASVDSTQNCNCLSIIKAAASTEEGGGDG